MPPTIQTTQAEQIERFLRVRNWIKCVSLSNPFGEAEYESPDGAWRVQITKEGYWALQSRPFPNAIGEGSTFKTLAEGDTLAELEKEMVSVGAMEWECPYCGESGGDPVTNYSREWQGDEYHGGMVEWSEQMCTKCTRAAAEHSMKLAIEGF